MYIQDTLKKKAETYFKYAQTHMGDAIGIELQHFSLDKMVGTMPVNENTIQPFGVLHGGASVVLAESLCSIGAWFQLDDQTKTAVGVEINANHIRSVKKGGMVTGTAKPVNIGRKIQVWECEIRDEKDKLVCTSRCTLAVVSI